MYLDRHRLRRIRARLGCVRTDAGRLCGAVAGPLDLLAEAVGHRREPPDGIAANCVHLLLDGRGIARNVGCELGHLRSDHAGERQDDPDGQDGREKHRGNAAQSCPA
jgi:hypothetical protein